MRLVSLEVQGLKSLRNTKVDGLESYNVFIGKNDSGKSTILQALRLMQAMKKGVDSGGLRELITDKPERGGLRVSVTCRLSDAELNEYPGIERWLDTPAAERVRCWRYDVEARVGDRRWPEGRLYLTACGPVEGDDYGRVFRVDDLDAPTGYRVLQTGHLEMLVRITNTTMKDLLQSLPRDYWSVTPSEFVDVSNLIASGDFYWTPLQEFVNGMTAIPHNRGASDEQPLVPQWHLDPSGANLLQVLDTLHVNDRRQYRFILQLARQLFPDLADVHFTREGEGGVLRIAYLPDQEPLDSFRLSQVGTGVEQGLILATAVVSATEGAVVLVEEPENNLHAASQRVLAAWLRRHASDTDKQILLATHSTVFASQEERCSSYLVRLDDEEGTIVRKLEPGGEAAVKEELGIRNVDLYGYDMVVLCEGDSEGIALPIIFDVLARKHGSSLHSSGLTWRSLGGSGKAKVDWVREFLGLLDATHIIPYVIVDDDPGVEDELERLVRQGVLPAGHYYVWREGRHRFGRNPKVGSEFEDNFTDQQLVDAAMAMAKDEGVGLELSAGTFARRCTSPTKKTSKVLADYCWLEEKYGFSKTELNRRLATCVAKELTGETARSVKDYEFERVASDIFRRLGLESSE
jgi:predicted ATPase